MDDNECVCPLCCEELDISDQQFYPCKCGYQVCMWCWHRIRESESGLCPACRTPYGDDPHEFSAVDVEEVLKANKEVSSKKKEDKSQLANMRVIRRNLVYAVGLPPSIATEETLKKPEYFGQYGKISKIVLNRTNVTGGDPRRASASAYVTFCHKEDTLACILALDGFFMDGRNVRASYGTSKYCSAFIKNVKCNNPDCTYLHCMGEPEDTFTKQEIQAGYVTSGRDVLHRQQQIVAQALSQNSSSSRRKVGGGGPSGTGKNASNPIFPPPCFDEPQKPTLVPPPPTTTVNRSVSAGANGFSAPPPTAAISRSVSTSAAAATAKKKGVIGAPGATAASVVAGVHSITPATTESSPHTTLTPLTPLKRTTAKKTEDLEQRQREMAKLRKSGTAPTSPSSSVSSASGGKMMGSSTDFSVGSIGGSVIGGTVGGSLLGPGAAIGGQIGGGRSNSLPIGSGSGALGGQPIGGGSSSSLGGEVFTGQLPSRPDTAVGSQKDNWNGSGSGIFGSGSLSGGDIWESPAPIGSRQNSGRGAPGVIGGKNLGSIGSQRMDHAMPPTSGGSSALASMLGINLPTGTGSLRDSSLWSSSSSQPTPLNGSSAPGAIGSSSNRPIGGQQQRPPNNNNSDMALLQSLLPGVHITSGNAKQPAAAGGQPGGFDTWGERERKSNIW